MTRLACCALLLAGCATSGPAPDPGDGRAQADYEAELARLSDEIAAAIGEARADSLAQCRAVGVRAKPCGGAWEYRVYSAVDGDPEQVAALAAARYALSDEMNRRFGIASDCAVTAAPEVVLEGGRCVTGQP
jgi:hypothetical protein